MSAPTDAAGRPSAFFESQYARLAEAAAGREILDLACGRGRHAIAAAHRGAPVRAVDRNPEALEALAKVDVPGPGSIRVECVDLETPGPPALPIESFGAVIVSRYLHRPLMPWIASLLAPGGLLLYETFLTAQRELGWGPRRDAFLLEAGELPTLFPGLDVLLYEEGLNRDDPRAETARLLARRPR